MNRRPNLDDLCICGHTRELHFGHECTIVAGATLAFAKRDCPCKQFVELGLAVPIFDALEELVSAVKDGLRRSAAHDVNAIRSNLISVTLRQAEDVLRRAQFE